MFARSPGGWWVSGPKSKRSPPSLPLYMSLCRLIIYGVEEVSLNYVIYIYMCVCYYASTLPCMESRWHSGSILNSFSFMEILSFLVISVTHKLLVEQMLWM